MRGKVFGQHIAAAWRELRGRPGPLDDFWYTAQATPSSSGISVTADSALRFSAVYACVRVLAETVAQLPLQLYRRTDDGRELADKHPLYPILHRRPNPEMTAFQYRETMMAHLCLRGNHYSIKERDQANRLRALWPLLVDRVTVKRPDPLGPLVYEYRDERGLNTYRAEEILHVRGMADNGIVGLSPLAIARDTIGAAIATHEFGSRFFSNGANPGKVYFTHPGRLNDEAYKHLRESLAKAHTGVANAHKPLILEEGMVANTLSITPEDSQFIETMKFRVSDIARIFLVPPHKIGDLERATFANITETNREFVKTGIVPWNVRIESAINMALLSEGEQETYYCEHVLDGLMRGDPEMRYRTYGIGRQWGLYSANECRRMENMEPLPDGRGDSYMVPVNMQEAWRPGEGKPEPAPTPAPEKQPADDSQPDGTQPDEGNLRSVAYAFLPVFEDLAARMVRRERQDILQGARRLIPRSVDDFTAWLGEFYGSHEAWCADKAATAIRSLSDALVAAAGRSDHRLESIEHELTEGICHRLALSGREQVLSAARSDGLTGIMSYCDSDHEARARDMARETVDAACDALLPLFGGNGNA